MSLINDALKRASQSDRNRPGKGAPARPMKPAAPARGSAISWILPVVVVVALLLAALFFWKWWEASHPAVAATPAPAPAANVVAAPTPVAPAAPPPAAAPVATAPAKAADPIPAAPIVEPTWPTPLTLQGIFYSKTKPLALINGKTVGTGDEIGGAVVAKIEPGRVTVERNGHSKQLLLGGK